MITNTVTVDVGDNTVALIDRLAQQLGIATDKVITHYATLEAASGMIDMWLFGIPIALALLCIAILAGIAVFSTDANTDDKVGCVIGIIVLVVVMFVLSIGFKSGYVSAHYPESIAVKELIRQIR